MTRLLLTAAALLLLAAPALAQDAAELNRAKRYFNAGASAYEMGDYLAAIQALDAAYAITPLPAIAFSLAQAQRRQYFVSRDRAHLERAIALYRDYLKKVESGGRRADATDALAQLEPLAALAEREAAPPPVAAEGDRTRLMITCNAPGARVALDDGPSAPAPLIARVAPGMHRLMVSAPGHVDNVRAVEALAGELIPIEVSLQERPASVTVRSRPLAELQLDGRPIGEVAGPKQLSLASGDHRFGFLKNGYRPAVVRAQLAPGETREIAVELETTAQRTAAVTLFVVGGAALAVSAVLTGFAVASENSADALLQEREVSNITAAQLQEYDEAKDQRDRLRVAAITGYGISIAALVTGLFLYALDQPELGEQNLTLSPQGARLRF